MSKNHTSDSPSPLQQAVNLTNSAVQVVTSAAKGNPIWVPEDVYLDRFTICLSCEHNREAQNGRVRCSKCNCRNTKLRFAKMKCPDKPPRWEEWQPE